MANDVTGGPRPRVAVLGGKSALRAARALGAECVYVERPDRLSEAKVALADHALPIDCHDVDRLRRELGDRHRDRPFTAVLSMTEDWLEPAAELNASLGLGGASVETVRLLRDKYAMRRLLAGTPLELPSARGTSAADIAAFGRRYGFPCVVKPLAGSGSSGVSLVRDQRQADDAVDRLARLGVHEFLVERYLTGPEFSVESLSFAGEHAIVAVTEKFVTPSFVEIGHLVPARLTPDVADAIAATVRALLDAVGLRDGAAHTEVIVGPDGPAVVESHNRVGGDRINELVRIAYGVDMIAAAVAWQVLRRRAHLPTAALAAAAIRFVVAPPGLVRSIRRGVALDADPEVVEVEVNVVAGARISSVESSADRAGHVLARAATPAEALAAAERAASSVTIETARDEEAA